MFFNLTISTLGSESPYQARLRCVREMGTGRLLLHEERWAFFWSEAAEETQLVRGATLVTEDDPTIRGRFQRAFTERWRGQKTLTYLGMTVDPIPLIAERMEAIRNPEIAAIEAARIAEGF